MGNQWDLHSKAAGLPMVTASALASVRAQLRELRAGKPGVRPLLQQLRRSTRHAGPGARGPQDGDGPVLRPDRLDRARRTDGPGGAADAPRRLLRADEGDRRVARRAAAAEALLLAQGGELERAEALVRTAVETAEARTDTVWWQAWTHEDLATVLERAGRIDEAREALERSLAIWERKGCLACAQRIRDQIAALTAGFLHPAPRPTCAGAASERRNRMTKPIEVVMAAKRPDFHR